MRRRGGTGALVLGVALAACGGRGAPPRPDAGPQAAPAPPPDRLATLRAFEAERRRTASFAHIPASDRSLGPDPIAIEAMPVGRDRVLEHFVGLLRGRDALVLLDTSLREIARAPTPPLPTGLAVAEDGEIVVSGEQAAVLARYRVLGDRLVRGARGRLAARARARVARRGPAARERRVRGGRAGGAGSSRCRTARAPAPARWCPPVPAPSGSRARATSSSSTASSITRSAIFDLDGEGMPADEPRAAHPPRRPDLGLRRRPHVSGPPDRGRRRRGSPARPHRGLVRLRRLVRLSLPRGARPRARAARRDQRLRAGRDHAQGHRRPRAPRRHRRLRRRLRQRSPRRALNWAADLSAPPPTVTIRTSLPGVASMALGVDRLVFADPLLDAWFSIRRSGAFGLAPRPGPRPGPGRCARATRSPASARPSSSPT